MIYYINPESIPSANGIYKFKKEAEIKNDCKGTINIFASTRYILYINDKYVCEGPCTSPAQLRYYDSVEYDFKKGICNIEIKVMHTTTSLSTVCKTPLPEIVFEAIAGDETIVSDDSWKCFYMSSYNLVRFAMRSLPPFEQVVAEKDDIELKVVNRDACVFKKDGGLIGGGAALSYYLVERPIPMIYPGKEVGIKSIKSGEGFVEYDAGVYITSKVKFDIAKNSKVKIIYSECYEFSDGKRKRDDTSGTLDGYFDTVTTGNEDFIYEPFSYRAFRFIRIEGDVDAIKGIKANRINYPYEINGSFECSDASFNEMQKVSQNTLLCCAHDMIVDCPYYEQQQYQFDSFVQAAATYRMTSDRRLIKKMIDDFAMSQMPDGLLLSVAPSASVVQLIPSYSLMWIMILKDYLENTADTEFVKRYTGVMDAVLEYFARKVSDKGYISSDSKYWNFFDWVPEWHIGTRNGIVPVSDDEAHTLYNMYYAYVLLCASYICEKIGRKGLALEYKTRWQEMADIIKKHCYHDKKQMFKDGSNTETFSMHTIIWAVLSDVVTGDEAKALLEKLSSPGISKATFSMNYFLFRALEKYDLYKNALPYFNDWQIMLDNNCTTWCENPDSPRSECHGWSSSPLCEFSSNFLGVKTGLDDEIVIKPFLGNLSYAKGNVPHRLGDVYVSWTVNKGVFNIEIKSLKVNKKLIMPNGDIHTFCDEKASFECVVE